VRQAEAPELRTAWRLIALGLGTIGFAMGDVLVEPMAGRCWRSASAPPPG
jgi:hypothetical protein